MSIANEYLNEDNVFGGYGAIGDARRRWMNSPTAKKVLRLANQITTRILKSIDRVKANAPEHAALRYRTNALQILDPLSDIVFNLWERFPELEPESERGVVYYDPDKWNMPAAQVRRAATELARAQSDLDRLVQLLEVSPERADKPLEPAAKAVKKHVQSGDEACEGRAERADTAWQGSGRLRQRPIP